jgi:hypothetical protein
MKNIEILKAKVKEIEDDKVEKWLVLLLPIKSFYYVWITLFLNFLKLLNLKLLIFLI